MKILLNWLKDYIDIEETPEKIADALNMAGLEVEEIIQPGKNLNNVVVGEILTMEKHPDADKLSLCKVNANQGEPLQIVCGAKNMKPGDKVPVALVGAKLPSGFEISRAKIRGIESFGMMCSKAELELAQDSSGLLILPPETPIGQDIVKALGMDEVIFDISLTPNRGDALSHLGVARELSAIFNLPMNRAALGNDDGSDNIENEIQIEIENDELCPRYGARVVKNVKVGPAPEWMQRRLEAIGIRAINNVVDITNYVMHDIGHPMHAFDLDKIKDRKIIIRSARANETLITLDEQERKLDSSMLVIADNEKPVALAGVMGGLDSSVNDKTRDILLEGASFDPVSIRKTAKRLSMMSESSYRFERGTNIDNVPIALNEAARLLKKYSEAEPVKGIFDAYPKQEILSQVRVRTRRVNKIIGINLSPAQIETYLLRLKLETRREGEDLIVSVPPYRHDIEIEADLIEEIARMYGYNNIPETLPAITSVLQLPSPLQKLEKRMKHHLVSLGFNQIISYSFIPADIDKSFREKKPLNLQNPLSEDQASMRTSLKWGMFDAIRRNILNDEFDLKLFETGKIFHSGAGEISQEHSRICLGFSGAVNPLNWRSSHEKFDLFIIKGIVENIARLAGLKFKYTPGSCSVFHPALQIDVLCEKTLVGQFGKLHPRFLDNKKMPEDIFMVELDLGMLAEKKTKIPRMQPIPEIPAIRRDLALLVPEKVNHRDIMKIINSEAGKLLEDSHLFDIYQGKGISEGYRSMAYSLTFRDNKQTLTDEQIEPLISKIVDKLSKNLEVELR
ncbi:MAG: phenylalanine--tRNA ligase subunit beta [Candidatus Rifleibacteriota bacterium]